MDCLPTPQLAMICIGISRECIITCMNILDHAHFCKIEAMQHEFLNESNLSRFGCYLFTILTHNQA